MNLYMATDGNDTWSGRVAAANAAKTDGPLATFPGVLRRLQILKQAGELDGPATVYLRGGVYRPAAPIVLRPQDSWPVTFKPYGREKVVISGGRRIAGWRKEKIKGRTVWVAELPAVREGKWEFRELFVNGRRAQRPRFPKRGLFRMAEVPGLPLPAVWGPGGYTAFKAAPGDVQAFANLGDVEVVYVHFWIEERSPIESFDPDTNLVTMTRPSHAPLAGSFGSELADYYLDNVFEALDAPGEWYLDKPGGRLFYLPRPGEDPRTTEVIAPVHLQLLALLGDPAGQRYVEHVRFEGLTFAHTDWRHPSHDGAVIVGAADAGVNALPSRRSTRGNSAGYYQSASDVCGVISLVGARYCAIEDCTIEHIGWYGIEIADGCHAVRVVGNTIRDMGAGGVKINGAAARDPEVMRLRTGCHRVTDNEITQGGRIFHSAAGVLSMHAFGMLIAHNHIHDLFYTGISCGWVWGYQESVSRDNRIEFNHIHNLGQGLLSDMGGVYTLGVQPGTVIRCNLIHDVRSAHYGGWCIYPDEGSSHLLIENNICYDADRNPFHQHYGRENMVVNNIFAFGGDSAVTFSRAEAHVGFTLQRNILVGDGTPFFSCGHAYALATPRHRSELNLLYDVSGRRPRFRDAGNVMRSLAEWRAFGFDRHTVVADPGFRNLAKRDFRLAPGSAAERIGFVPIDLSAAGPRPAKERAET